MNKQIDRIKKTRLYLLDLVKDLSVEQLNEIPGGFNNNIIWHLGHMIAAQQGICYVRAGIKPFVEEKYINLYKPGTKPEQVIDGNEAAMLKDVMLSSLDRLDADVSGDMFTNYVAFTTRYGVELANIDDALDFLLFHEGLHAGHITAMKKLVKG